MPNIKVLVNYYTDVTREADPDDEWDADNLAHSTDVLGLQEVADDKYFDIAIPFKLEKDTHYFLVMGVYSTGDSFHNETGVIEYVDVFCTLRAAQTCKTALEQNDKHFRRDDITYEDSLSCKLIRDDNSTYDFYVPWTGYFEYLEYVDIVEVYLVNVYLKP